MREGRLQVDDDRGGQASQCSVTGEEGLDGGVLRPGQDFAGRALFGDDAVDHDGGAVGDVAGEATSWVTMSMVIPVAARRLMTSSTSPTRCGIERRGGLVEQHELGLHGERAGDGDALLLAARELAREGVGFVGEPDLREQRARARRGPQRRFVAHPDRRVDDVLAAPTYAGTG